MNNEIRQEIEALKRRVAELEAWKVQRTRQQITFPLDVTSIDVLRKFFMSFTGSYVYFGGAAANPFLVYEGKQGTSRFELSPPSIEYKANPDNDFIQILYPDRQSFFVDDQQIVLLSTGSAPAGLSDLGAVVYYVVNATADGASFQLSLTLGGAEVDFTDEGIGRQFISRL